MTEKPAADRTDIQIAVVPLPKERLDHMLPEERNFLILCGHIANELNILQKLVIWTSNFDTPGEIEARANVVQALLIAKLLASKLWEASELVRKAFVQTNLSKGYLDAMDKRGQEAFESLQTYFADTENLIKTVRDKFAFHYDPVAIGMGYEHVQDSDLVFYVAGDHANSVYYASEAVANLGMLELIQPGEPQKAMDRLMDETIRVAGWFLRFINKCMRVAMGRYFGDSRIEVVTLKGVPDLEALRIPYFTCRPGRAEPLPSLRPSRGNGNG